MADPHAYLAGLQPLAMRFGLERMQRALDALGRPERAYPVLHVGGTNGKGSTCAMAAAALAAAGHEVGLYTSPHLVRFNERIQVRGAAIGDDELAAVVEEIRRACPWHDGGGEGDRLTYFEFATLAGLLHFARAGVGAAVVEVGLGGRFDATNAIVPRVTAIAAIGLDHTQLLGDTVERIAVEKAGIFKPGVPAVVHGRQPPAALEALHAEAVRRGAPFVVAARDYPGAIALPGPHQRGNAGLADAALRQLSRAGVALSDEAIARGIATARWPGRLEEVAGVLLDGAHNPDGAAALAAALRAMYPGRPVELVFGVLADKDHARMLAALVRAARALHVVTPASTRARPADEVAATARGLGAPADVHDSVADAIACARRAALPGGVVCVAGSLYLVGEARDLLVPG
ncbi:folylpolyglutamate synthase/dihydrofolate synthase family protein [Anaeromyxobacter sp. Fw109-5]|uniref:bifunctional folylpolyglutamate synthase/dihydrofolate synthase n=1 Tax=Anaeromyxobacter sp. (strain Fw109-5) TaxID=404589 RepID=UPI0000ED759F|nr:folylpolyglutamate synthase/dihydrofolate synthase family protein [Anaeromyxobacter sp. Fw109-5]ABS26711.1 FolC bifunctional protein [Anaeromyxobacter sp. Fw109-5]